ncbi:hypothetical protein OBBRIDRAFT_797451 [Obba rivulosa]|uniref:Uncharacterized protein n=1 Tax=Obba rivulosa TaxID=1052685 RepID=A0A8E2DGN5_9APHY|nr:hypothetical protein OBBRIDRAFT_797451 [Obba rivulosa]
MTRPPTSHTRRRTPSILQCQRKPETPPKLSGSSRSPIRSYWTTPGTSCLPSRERTDATASGYGRVGTGWRPCKPPSLWLYGYALTIFYYSARVWGRSLICADVHRHAQRCKLSKYVMCNHMQEAIAQAAVRQAEEAMRFGEEEDWEHGEDLEPISEGSQAAEPLIAGEHSGEDVEDVDLEEADPEDADPEDSDYDPEDDPFVWDSKLTPFPEESQATEPPIADEHSTEDVEDADLEKADLEDADLEDPEYDPEDDPFAWDSKLTFAAEDDSFATENMTAFKTTQYESHDDKQNNETGEVSNVPDSDDASFPDDPSATSSRRSHCPSPKANFVPDPFDAFDDDSSAENENTFLHDDHNAESLRRSPCLSPKVDYVPDPFDAPNDGEDTANEDAPLYGDSNAESLPLSPRFSPEDFIPDPFDAPDDGGDTEVEDEDRALHGIALPRLQDIPAWSIEGDNTVLDGEFNESLAQGNGTPHRLKPWHQGRLPIRRRPLIWRYIPEPAPVYEEEEEENWDRESTSSEEEELDNSPETDDEEDKD